MLSIAIALFEGVEELDAMGPYQVFRSAKDLGAKLKVELVSLEPEKRVHTFHGIEISNVSLYSAETLWDVFIIPGGGWLSKQQTGVRRLIQQGIWPNRISQMNTRGTVVVGICSGAFILGAAGLLRDRAATTHHKAFGALSSYGAKGIHKRVVDTGTVITAAGIAAGIDLAFWIVERFLGTQFAKQTEEYIEYRRQGHVVKIPYPAKNPKSLVSKLKLWRW